MRYISLVLVMLPAAVWAQNPEVMSEELWIPGMAEPMAPQPPETPVVAKPLVAVPTPTAPLMPEPMVSPSIISTFFVPNLRAELPALGISSTLRDMALNQAALDGLGRVLDGAEPPLAPAVQARIISDTVTPMNLVKNYRIADEILTPSYTLVVDMSYDPVAVQALVPSVVPQVPVTPEEVPPTAETTVPALPSAPTVTVRVSGNAASQDKVLGILKGMTLTPVYTRLAVDGADLAVPGTDTGTLTMQLRAKGLVVEDAFDGVVEVKF